MQSILSDPILPSQQCSRILFALADSSCYASGVDVHSHSLTMQGAMMNHKVISNGNGELLGESESRKGADLMAACFEIQGIACRVESREQRKAPVSKMARLHVELLESRN